MNASKRKTNMREGPSIYRGTAVQNCLTMALKQFAVKWLLHLKQLIAIDYDKILTEVRLYQYEITAKKISTKCLMAWEYQPFLWRTSISE